MRPLLALALAMLMVPRSASANGRFPNATQLVAAPNDPARFALRATYGLIQTFNGGTEWAWVCEAAVGYRGTFDPAIVIASDGTLAAGLPDGLSWTADRGCSWRRSLGPSLVIDLARSSVAAEKVFALSLDATSSVLHASNDGGRRWVTISTLTDMQAETVDVAPSMSSRVYISGVADRAAVILRSDDGGATFASTKDAVSGVPYIAAVDPTNPDVLYVRTQNVGVDAADAADALFVSTDGARTFSRVSVPVRQMLGVALSPDGELLAVGGPDDGLYIGRAADRVFARTSALRVRCLTWTSAALFACSSRDADGFAVGRSVDQGSTFTKFFDVPDLRQLACPATSTVTATCAESWQAVSSMIGEDPNAFVPDAAASPHPAQPPPAAEATCGRCHFGAHRSVTPLLLAGLTAAIATARRARRTVVGSPPCG